MVRCEEEELRLEEEEEVGLVVLGGRWKVDQRKVEGGKVEGDQRKVERWKVDQRKVEGGPTEDGKVEGGR